MARDEHLPIDRGEYDENLADYAGVERVIEDRYYNSTNIGLRTHHPVTVKLVKNSSGVAILPKMAVSYKAGTNETEVDGFTDVAAEDCAGVADEHLPSAGVPTGNYFWIVVDGPTLGIVSKVAAEAVISEGSFVVAATAAASTHSTTAGRVKAQDLSGATAPLANNVQNAFARALSGRTTADTGGDILLMVGKRFK